MKNFTYYRPATAEQAVGLLDAKWGTAELLAGGTDLHDLQKEYVAQPDKVISVSGIGELAGIKVEGDTVTIGAATKLAEIAEHADLQKLFPGLTTPAGDIGGPQIRNMGTLGGNLCQRNRCWYFRDEHVQCLLKGGDKCFALDGENRYHAIFTQGHKCVIVNPSTLAPALIALGASAEVLGPGGKRTIALAEFFHAPVSASEREHVLAPNEMVRSVTIPNKGAQERQLRGAAQASVRLAPRPGGRRVQARRRQGERRADRAGPRRPDAPRRRGRRPHPGRQGSERGDRSRRWQGGR